MPEEMFPKSVEFFFTYPSGQELIEDIWKGEALKKIYQKKKLKFFYCQLSKLVTAQGFLFAARDDT